MLPVIEHLDATFGKVVITNPSFSEIGTLIKLLLNEDLDVRRLSLTSSETHITMPESKLKELWARSYMMSGLYKKEVKLQAEGLLSADKIPPAGTIIKDAFRMKEIEYGQSIQGLQKTQLINILVMKREAEIISSVRVLPVDKDWELVSLVTKNEYRRQGLGSLMVRIALKVYPNRPLFSFQTVDMIPFYMKLYRNEKPIIPKFSGLPIGMRIDLLNMNLFWGPYTIIRIDGSLGD